MTALVIHAHPEEKSFCTSLKNTAVKFFADRGDEIMVSDLYAMDFNPVGDRQDFKSLYQEDFFKYQIEQVNAYKNGLFTEDIKNEMEKVLQADLLIFNFPLWWFSVPAMLKGWVDRVFAMGFAYGAGKGVYDTGVFKEKKAFCCLTTGGPKSSYGPEGRNGNLDTILYHINHGMLYFVGMQTLPPFVAYSPARLSDEERKIIIENYKSYLTKMDLLKPIF